MKLKVGLFNFYKPLVKKKTSVGKSILRKVEGLLTLQVYLNTSKKIRKRRPTIETSFIYDTGTAFFGERSVFDKTNSQLLPHTKNPRQCNSIFCQWCQSKHLPTLPSSKKLGIKGDTLKTAESGFQ